MDIPNRYKKIFRQLKSRQGRKKSDYYICEGLRSCQEAFKWISADIELVISNQSLDLNQFEGFEQPYFCLNDQDFSTLSHTENPQGIILLIKKKEVKIDSLNGQTIIAFDRLSDPGNVGTILRTALAAGIRSAVWVKGGCDPFSAKAIRSGMGAQFAMTIYQIDSIEDLKKYWPDKCIWLSEINGGKSCYDSEYSLKNSILVMGNEANGVMKIDQSQSVTIPMPGPTESLNVAQAATILIFEALRRSEI